jgi:hypothetical protein
MHEGRHHLARCAPADGRRMWQGNNPNTQTTGSGEGRLRERVVSLPHRAKRGATPQFVSFVSFVSFVREDSEMCWTER